MLVHGPVPEEGELPHQLTFSPLQGPVASAAAAPPRAPAGGCPPPPPPGPPPPPMAPDTSSSSGGEDVDRNALFASINQGFDITRGKHSKIQILLRNRTWILYSTAYFPAVGGQQKFSFVKLI